MLLRSIDLDALRKHSSLRSDPTGITLDAAAELACAVAASAALPGQVLVDLCTKYFDHLPLFRSMRKSG